METETSRGFRLPFGQNPDCAIVIDEQPNGLDLTFRAIAG
jgi:hypothetical protein